MSRSKFSSSKRMIPEQNPEISDRNKFNGKNIIMRIDQQEKQYFNIPKNDIPIVKNNSKTEFPELNFKSSVKNRF